MHFIFAINVWNIHGLIVWCILCTLYVEATSRSILVTTWSRGNFFTCTSLELMTSLADLLMNLVVMTTMKTMMKMMITPRLSLDICCSYFSLQTLCLSVSLSVCLSVCLYLSVCMPLSLCLFVSVLVSPLSPCSKYPFPHSPFSPGLVVSPFLCIPCPIPDCFIQ